MYIVKILFRNAFRHKLRTFLTILGITIAILAFGLLRTVLDAWDLAIEASSDYRLVTRNAVSMVFPLPISYREKILQIEGVTQVNYGNWFGGVYIDQKNFFANMAVEARTFLELYPELVMNPRQAEDFIRDRKGFIAGKKLARKYGWKIGDIVTLQGTIYPGNWDFVLRGIYTGKYASTDETQFFFHWDYLNETVKKISPRRADQAGYFVIGIRNPEQSAAIAASIDNMFKNSLAETLTETEKAFTQGFLAMVEAIIVVVQLVSFIIIIIIMAVVANTMSMTTRERIGEYAILKALGFRSGHITLLIGGESVVITLLGCLFGIILLFPAARIFGSTLEQYFPVFEIKTRTLYFDLFAALVVAIAAAIVPIHTALKIRIADGLRRIA